MKKNISQIIDSIKCTKIKISDEQDFDVEISNLAFDTKNVCEGTLFFALPGTHISGNFFIDEAIKKGAVAVIFQGELDSSLIQKIKDALKNTKNNVQFYKVEDSRFAMAPVSAKFYDFPSKKIAVVGVTGTEGKSSTVSFVWQLLRLSGFKAGFISTVQYSVGDEAQSNPEHTTTPEAPIIQKYLYEMVQNGCEYAVLETSSHGLSLKLNRTGSIDFDAGIFMNVTLEHLEFHGTFEQYRDDKANLFRKLDQNDHKKIICGKEVTVPSFGVVNLEDESAPYFIKATKKSVVGFTTEGKAGKQAVSGFDSAKPLPKIPKDIPYILARNLASASFGLSFSITEPNLIDEYSKPVEKPLISIKSRLPGAFNAYNIMAALITVSRLTSIPLEKVAEKVSELVPVKGRMTVVDEGQNFEVIVDYAHTPSSFETIFPPIKRRTSHNIIAVFGSGGERDTKKRPLQGAIAAKFCDYVILTDEDPRKEDSLSILNAIAEGSKKEGKIEGKDLFLIPDRPKAIRKAFSLAQKDDIVLLLGKSHENSIIYSDGPHSYDEITEAKKALSELK